MEPIPRHLQTKADGEQVIRFSANDNILLCQYKVQYQIVQDESQWATCAIAKHYGSLVHSIVNGQYGHSPVQRVYLCHYQKLATACLVIYIQLMCYGF